MKREVFVLALGLACISTRVNAQSEDSFYPMVDEQIAKFMKYVNDVVHALPGGCDGLHDLAEAQKEQARKTGSYEDWHGIRFLQLMYICEGNPSDALIFFADKVQELFNVEWEKSKIVRHAEYFEHVKRVRWLTAHGMLRELKIEDAGNEREWFMSVGDDVLEQQWQGNDLNRKRLIGTDLQVRFYHGTRYKIVKREVPRPKPEEPQFHL